MDSETLSIAVIAILILVLVAAGVSTAIDWVVPPSVEWYTIIVDDVSYTCRYYKVSDKGASIDLTDCNDHSENTISISGYTTLSVTVIGVK